MLRCSRTLLAVLVLLICCGVLGGCRSHGYSVFHYDNGDDYLAEGLRRIVDDSGKIGFADEKGRVIISPRYAFAFPFEGGRAKATFEGESVAEGEYHRWVSPAWFYIDRNGHKISKLNPAETIEQRLKEYVADKDARIGVAVIINGRDTVSVNGSRDFPMMSVFKFPQALAVADYCLRNGVSLSDSVSVKREEIKPDTWSPMREKYGSVDLRLPIYELLDYSVGQSDNNACDILFRVAGGTQAADSLMTALGFEDIDIQYTEAEMHTNVELCYLNRTTPLAMARLFDLFFRRGMRHDSPIHEAIGEMMLTCKTGERRLPAALADTAAAIAHKTGTGDRNSRGRIIAVNDAGYVYLPGDTGYAIVVFIADSAYSMEQTERLIAEISAIVYEALSN